jgi:hypothetical protein
MSEVTYGRLDEVLRSLGFSVHVIEEKKARLYKEEETGALVALPLLPLDKEVLPHHLLAVRSILQAYGIAEAADFATKLQKAS